MCQLLGSHRDKDDSVNDALKYRITIFSLQIFYLKSFGLLY